MSITLTVAGMHCEACRQLITSTIEELGLAQALTEVTLNQNQTGQVVLQELSGEHTGQIVNAINDLGLYKVTEINNE